MPWKEWIAYPVSLFFAGARAQTFTLTEARYARFSDIAVRPAASIADWRMAAAL